MQQLDHVNALLQKIEYVKRGPEADEACVKQAEQELGVSFPESYVAFLRRYGWLMPGAMGHVQGVGVDVPSEFDVVGTTLSERRELEPRMPNSLVPVMNDGAGNHFCLDTSRMENGECPVVFWDHESDKGEKQIPEVVAVSFIEWLLASLEEFIENWESTDGFAIV